MIKTKIMVIVMMIMTLRLTHDKHAVNTDGLLSLVDHSTVLHYSGALQSRLSSHDREPLKTPS